MRKRVMSLWVSLIMIITTLPILNVSAAGTANDILNAAYGECDTSIGYKQQEYDGCTKYGEHLGVASMDWCAAFVAWCANQAGISSDIIPRYSFVNDMISFYSNRGLYKTVDSYTPKAGDLFFLKDYEHVGIVISSDGNTVRTIEGNTSKPDFTGDSLYVSIKSRSMSYFKGFATPAYNNDTTAPIINNLNVSNISGSSFTVNCSANETLSRAYMIVYGPGGNSGNGFDIADINSSSFCKTINTSDYGGEGTYTVHIYVFDLAGNSAGGNTGSFSAITDTTVFSIQNLYADNISDSGFTIKCTASKTISRAYVIVYGPGGNSGNGYDINDINSTSFSEDIRTSDYGGTGTYTVHVYITDAYDNKIGGNTGSFVAKADTTPPIITDGMISDISSDSFRITAHSNKTLSRAYVIIYGPGGNSGNGYNVNDINSTSFNHEINPSEYGGTGEYTVHVYFYDLYGNSAGWNSGHFDVKTDTTGPIIEEYSIDDISKDGFTINCKTDKKLARVYVIVYGPGGNSGNGFDILNINDTSFCKTINSSDYGGEGTYVVHTYAFDLYNNSTGYNSGRFCVADATSTTAPTPTPTSIVEPLPTSTTELAYNGTASIKTTTAVAGDTIEIPVSISNNPGIAGFNFVMSYDNTVLTPVSISKGSEFSDGTLNSNINQGGDLSQLDNITVYWSNPSDVTLDGDMFTVSFKVSDSAAAGTYPITISYNSGDITNQYLDDVMLGISNGSVEVTSVKKGDVFEDGAINTKDGVLLSQYLAKWDVNFTDRQLKAADVYEDGTVNTKDGVRLSQVLAKWNGVTLSNTMSLMSTGKLAVSVGNVSAAAGEYIDIPVIATENSGIAGFNFTMNYNKARLVPVSISAGDDFCEGMLNSNINQGSDLSQLDNVTAYWSNPSNVTACGIMFTVRFKVSDTAVGEIPIELTYSIGDICDQNLDDVDADITGGKVTINTQAPEQTVYSYIITALSMTDENGNTLTDFPVNTGFMADIGITETEARDAEDYLFAAVYDNDGVLLSLNYIKTDFVTDKTYNVGIYIQAQSKQIGAIKAFIWNSFDNAAPLAESKIIQ